jgi:Ca2+-transporting ATPase
MQERKWHNLSGEEVIKILGANLDEGLSLKEVGIRQKKFGKNIFPEEKPLSKLRIFLKQAKNPLIYILIIAGTASLLLKDYTDAIVIFSTVLLNFVIGFFQENKTSRVLAELKKIVKVKAYVIRGGNEKEIAQEDLMPGDVILLHPGDKVPADARLIESYNLKINEASLTGEWISAEKKIKILPPNTPLGDRDNMVYTGTVVEEGKGRAVVTETGLGTEIGKVIEMVRGTKEEKTPYQKKVARFSIVLGLIIAIFCISIFIFGIITGKGYLEMLLTATAVAVAAVPEGLPAAVTVTFAFGLQAILRRRGLVREMLAAETLGSTSVIASDKTGTLTEAKMQVAGIYTGAGELLSDGQKYTKEIDKNGKSSHLLALKIATLCCEAFVENPEESLERLIIKGRPTDKALMLAGIQAGLNKKELLRKEPKIADLAFDPVYKYSASLNKISEKDPEKSLSATNEARNIFYILGAPEIILKMSKFVELDGKQKIFSEEEFEKLNKKYQDLAKKGERVLATAYRIIGNNKIKGDNLKGFCKDLIFVGFISLRDPLRKDAKTAIKICQKAGMRVIIVTGDHKLTAKAIAEELGLPSKEENIVEGNDLDKMSDKELRKNVRKIEIYARVEPRHKMRIIQAWQDEGEIVAMTGDGVNDAPALKKANIGVALGSGTEVAKESSDLILLTDNFSIIITAVEEGRRIMDNIRKIITYLLAGGFTEIMLIGLSIIFRLPLPVLPGQILWKNLIESTPPAMALTFESAEKDIMNRSPEDLRLPLLNKEMNVLIFIIGILTNIILFGLFLWFLHAGYPIELIRSIIFVGLAIDSFFFIFSCRNLRKNIWQYNLFSNKYINLSITAGFLFLIIALYLPLFQKLLKTVPLGFFEWSVLLGFGFLNLVLIEAAKWYFIKKQKT